MIFHLTLYWSVEMFEFQYNPLLDKFDIDKKRFKFNDTSVLN